MVEIRTPISVSEAIARIEAHVAPLAIESVPLADSYGRVLAEPIVATYDVPPFHRAPYDGFAIRAIDSSGASGDNRIAFHVVDHIGAGALSAAELGEKEAVRIMTGAALPNNADAVVMFEQATENDHGFTIRKPFSPLENVSLRGEDAKEGETIIAAGTIITPGTIALLATFGYAHVRVAAIPVVGIIATGSELLAVEDDLQPGKIRNSNGPMITAQLARIGVRARSYGIMGDNLESSLALVAQALAETDSVITTGGVSVGDYDYLPAIYERLGATVLFNKVAMRPGSVTTVAVLDGKFLFGLSGNPSSCYTGFELFARPALLRMMGSNKPYLPYTQAILLEDFTKANPFARFVRAIYHYDGKQATVVPAGFNKSNAVTSIARGNAFIVLPGGSRGYAKGDRVDVLLLGIEEGEQTWRI